MIVLKKIIIFLFFSPFCLILILGNFLFRIRFYQINHFIGASHFLDTYFIDKKNGKYSKYIDLFFFKGITDLKDLNKNNINIFWSKLLSRKVCKISLDKPKLFIFKNKILGFIYKLVNFYNLKNLIAPIEKHRTLTLDEEKFYVKNNFRHINLRNDDIKLCQKRFEEINKLNSNNLPMVTINNRDGAFKKKYFSETDFSHHNYRNFNFDDYTKALEYACKKYFVIRSANVIEKHSGFRDKNFFEYGNSSLVSPDLDYYLVHKSKFYIGVNSGPDKFARLSNIPILYINDFHLLWSPIWSKKCISVPVKLFDNKKSKHISFGQMADRNYKLSEKTSLPVGLYSLDQDYKKEDIKIIYNTQEDILSAFKEMELLSDSTLNLDDEDIQLQKKFWKIFHKPHNNIDNFIISPSFLKKNSYLFS